VAPEYGGKGLGVFEASLVLEEVARACLASAMALQMNVNGPPAAIGRLGTEDQRRRYLPGAADGSRYFAIAMTEPQAGSSGMDLATSLRPDGDGFRLNGAKCYITGGARATDYLVFCRAEGTRGSLGIGAVLVSRDAAGFAEPEIERKMGGRGVAEATLRFHDVWVPAEDVVLPADPESKRGAQVLLTQFNPERCGNAAMSIGIAQAALDDAVSHALRREQFGRPIVEFQGLQWKLADMALDVETSRLLLWKAATSDADGFPETKATVMAKLHANEMVQRVTNEALQIHGHRGYSTEHAVERYYRDARGMAIGGGTTEILRNMLAAEVTGRRFSQRRSA
jgi:alkylation response protein AidB-like acyl-CoA dehydrogenase